MPFTCSICCEESTRICVRCTKDACDNHLCEKCRKCSDCCECEVTLAPYSPESVREALHGSTLQAEPVAEAYAAAAVPSGTFTQGPAEPESRAEPVAEADAAVEAPSGPFTEGPAEPESQAEPVAEAHAVPEASSGAVAEAPAGLESQAELIAESHAAPEKPADPVGKSPHAPTGVEPVDEAPESQPDSQDADPATATGTTP